MLQLYHGPTITLMVSRTDDTSCSLEVVPRCHEDGGWSYSRVLSGQSSGDGTGWCCSARSEDLVGHPLHCRMRKAHQWNAGTVQTDQFEFRY